MNDSRLKTLVLLASLVVWYVSGRAAVRAFTLVNQVRTGQLAPVKVSTVTGDTLVEQALSPTMAVSERAYRGGRGSPFLPEGRSGGGRRTAKVATARVPLYLNGVLLMASKPQAIIEDDAGKTWVAGVGDVVHGQKIVRIAPDKVVIRDGSSTYSIQVRK